MIRPKMAGIDVSAEWFDVCVLDGPRAHKARFPRSEAGYEELGRWLEGLGFARVWASLEHTGGYERELALWLLARGHKASVVDPAQALCFKRSLGRRAKTDQGDAYALARLTRERRPALFCPRPGAYERLLELVRHRRSLVEAITQWRNRRNAPKASELVHAQQQTIIEALTLQLREADAAIAEAVDSDPGLRRSVDLVRTIKGVEFVSAVSFLAEAGPVSGYPTPESLAMAAGLSPLPDSSGKREGRRRAPYGNRALRQSLAMAAVVARRHNPALAYFARRIESRGGRTKAQLNRAVHRKLCHVIWGMLTHQEPFDPYKAVPGFENGT